MQQGNISRADIISTVDILSSLVIKHPLSNVDAKHLIGRIVRDGTVGYLNHALDEMRKDALTTADVINVLRGGVVESCEEERRTWRYRVRTARMTVVVAFRSEVYLTVVTAWRK